MPQAASPPHIGRQSRPISRAFKSFSELSGDVENFELRHFVYHSGAMYTVLYHFWTPFARFSRVFAPQRYTTWVFHPNLWCIVHRSIFSNLCV